MIRRGFQVRRLLLRREQALEQGSAMNPLMEKIKVAADAGLAPEESAWLVPAKKKGGRNAIIETVKARFNGDLIMAKNRLREYCVDQVKIVKGELSIVYVLSRGCALF